MNHCSSCNQSFPDSVGSHCPLCGRLAVPVGDAVFPPQPGAPVPPPTPPVPPMPPGAPYGANPGAPYGAPPANPYGQPQPFVAVKSTNTSLGTVSLITGIIGLMFFPASLVAIATGHMARGRNTVADDSQRTQGLVGLIIGWIVVAFFLAIILFFIVSIWFLTEVELGPS